MWYTQAVDQLAQQNIARFSPKNWRPISTIVAKKGEFRGLRSFAAIIELVGELSITG